MFIIACTATCIFGSGWVTVAGSEVASIPGADRVGAVAVDKVGVVVVGGADDCAAGGADIDVSNEFESFSSEGYKLPFDGFPTLLVLFSSCSSATTVHSSSSCSVDSFSS